MSFAAPSISDSATSSTLSPDQSGDNSSQSTESDLPSPMPSRYALLEVIGRGSYSVVWKALDHKTGNLVSIKCIAMDSTNPTAPRVEKEVEIMKAIDHPTIVKFIDSFITFDAFNIVMEYVEGSTLLTYVRSHKTIPGRVQFKIVKQIVNAIAELHEMGICHRDLKLENILINKKHELKIIDFGLSKQLHDANERCKTPCGSMHYAAPEITGFEDYDPFKADMWSLGTILYTLEHHKLPFVHDNVKQLRAKIRTSVVEYSKDLSPDVESLIRHLLDRNPETRFSCEQLRQHEYWIKNLERYSPGKSAGAHESKTRAGILTKIFPFLKK